MVGSPGQTVDTLFEDLMFIKELQPEMAGIGPFIPHKDTPFAEEPAGTVETTLRLLAIIRLIHPHGTPSFHHCSWEPLTQRPGKKESLQVPMSSCRI